MTETTRKRVRKPRVEHDPLATYRVDPSFLDGYVSRIIGGISDLEIGESFYNRRRHLLLEGPTSSGKTFFVTALAAHLGIPLVTVSGAGGITEADIYGRWVPSGDGDELVFAEGPVTLAIRHGALVYVNEANFIPPDVLSSLLKLTDFRGAATIRGAVDDSAVDENGETEYRELVLESHPDLWVVVDGNPGYAGTQEYNAAFRNRFYALHWGYDPEVERALISSGALREFIAALRSAKEAGDLFSPVPTKQFVLFEEALYELGWDFALIGLYSYFHESERDFVRTLFEDGYKSRVAESYDLQLEEVDDED